MSGVSFNTTTRETQQHGNIRSSNAHQQTEVTTQVSKEILQLFKHSYDVPLFNTLSTPDLESASLVCKTFLEKVQFTCTGKTQKIRQTLLEIIALAKAFDDQIKVLTNGAYGIINTGDPNSKETTIGSYKFFRFDVVKWSLIVDHLNTPKAVELADELVKKCRLDLVEALAEYNIDSRFFLDKLDENALKELQRSFVYQSSSEQLKENRFIHNLVLPHNICEQPVTKELADIFEYAKRTVKGNVFVLGKDKGDIFYNSIIRNAEEEKNYTYALACVYAKVGMMNPESPHWQQSYYRNLNKDRPVLFFGEYLVYDQLTEKKEGDRLVISGAEKRDHRILRCAQQSCREPDLQGNFEEVLQKLSTKRVVIHTAYH